MCGSTQGSGQLNTTAAGSTKQALFQRLFTPLQENPASMCAGSRALGGSCSHLQHTSTATLQLQRLRRLPLNSAHPFLPCAEPHALFPPFFLQDVVISSDGQFALSGSWDGTLRLWDLNTGNTTRRFVGHTKDVLSVAFSVDNRQVGVFGEGGMWADFVILTQQLEHVVGVV